jgi:hypothetical protein
MKDSVMRLIVSRLAREAEVNVPLIDAVATAVGCPGWVNKKCDSKVCYCAKAAAKAVEVAMGYVDAEVAKVVA